VPPADKTDARLLIKNALQILHFGDAEKLVRINPVSTPFWRKDLEAVVGRGMANTIMVPKAARPDDIEKVDKFMTKLEVKLRVKRGTTRIMPIIESALGVVNAYKIAVASTRNVALVFGAEDFTRDIGGTRTQEGKEMLFAKSQIVVGAKAAGIQALDGIYSDFMDIKGLIEETTKAIEMGFDGKGAIHPSQIGPIHETFAPSAEAIEHAQKVVQALKDAKNKGLSVAALGGKMIDPPVAAKAERVLMLAEMMGLFAETKPKRKK
ncbi:MAG: CoA ester lyase, partial [Thermoplasmata archaeon]|nr:CoA ester lyase [Thermoplasmata archaeon]